MAFGEVCVDHAEQTASGVERDESPGVETDDLATVGGDDSVVHPTGRGTRDGGQFCPITDHLVGGMLMGLRVSDDTTSLPLYSAAIALPQLA